MKVPSPQEIGLPDKFDKWRPSQVEALDLVQRSTKRVVALCSPTGTGKSAVNVAVAMQSNLPTCIVTSSRGLQQQMLNDFESVGMVDLRGRNNYTCDMREGMTCEDGYAARCPYKGTVGCPSSAAEMRAATSSLITTNYAKWTACKKFGQGLGHIQQVIFDEGHEAPAALASAMQVVLNHKEIEDTLKIPFLPRQFADDVANWKPWAIMAKATAETEMMAAQARITGVSDPKPSWVRHYTHMRNLVRRLSIISTARAVDWVVDEVANVGYQFDPIRPGRYAESALLFRVPRVIITSATLRPKSLFMIGIGKDQFDFAEFNSDFDPKRCPIYYVPTMRVDSRTDDLRMLWVKFDQVMAKRRDRKGIIHTVSYNRRDSVVQASRFSDSMLINQKGEPASSMIEQFKNSPAGTILVSPSVGTGYDFPMSDCEYQIICKVPFPDGRSKILKARQADDKEYGAYQAMQTLIQAFGRGMRSKLDACENFCFDDHLSWFLPRYGHLAPKSFHYFFKTVNTLPQPPEKL